MGISGDKDEEGRSPDREVSMTPWRHYVYEHRRNDTGAVFYVGKGAFRQKRKPTFERAHDRTSRNKWWRNVVAKAGGYAVEIVLQCRTDADACAFEIDRIALYRGLVNLTTGGDGRRNGIFSEAERKKRSENAKGPRSDKWKAAIRASRKNGGNGGVVKRGDKLPQWWRDRISFAVTGSKNHMHGRTGSSHPNSRRVVDTSTGVEYPSVTAAANALNTRMQTLHNMLTGFRVNTTSMRLVDAA